MSQNTTHVGWVSVNEGRRGTASILWSCFSIFLVCTWSCLHLDLPSIEESEAGFLKWHGIPYFPSRLLLRKWRPKALWMILIVLAPELGVARATHDYLSAKAALIEAEENRIPDQDIDDVEGVILGMTEVKGHREKLTMSHAFFSNMGGFNVKLWRHRASISAHEAITNDSTSIDDVEQRLRMPRSRNLSPEIAEVSKTCFHESWLENHAALEELRLISPDIQIPSKEDIDGLSKSDAFTKIFACVQSIWLCIQCIARSSQGLPITQLELTTIAFVGCGILMYVLWWDKPFGVERRLLVVATDEKFAKDTEEGRELTLGSTKADLITGSYAKRMRGNKVISKHALNYASVGNIEVEDIGYIIQAPSRIFRRAFGMSNPPGRPGMRSLRPNAGSVISFYLSGMLFSALHILAWNWDFPSGKARIAWRVCAIVAAASHPIIFMTILVAANDVDWLGTVFALASGFVLVVDCLARIGLVALIFYCFSSMPDDVYKTVEWTQFLPHFS